MEECIILRVISGTAKGHKLKTLKGNSTRPTSDRVKESLFNIISGFCEDAEVLDLYAGTGNLGIEALSRGAKFSVFVDKSRECFDIIRENLNATKMSEKALIMTTEVGNGIQKLALESRKFDIIFLDPPYNKNLIEEALYLISKNVIIKDDGIIIAERDVADNIPEEVGSLRLVRNQKYGDTILSFYRVVDG
ncbi:MAG TPA: 16S rRNA (guanine(966)-N(2))-methyltransferase RsmD [Clostridia bacterium]|nr:16S rRNA (guanine(966)-N(2))-methyltransferase RsmD [Clostridia bacterium]